MFRNKCKGSHISLFLFICLFLVSLIGCSSTATPPTEAGVNEAGMQPKLGGTITVGIDIEPDSLDIHKSYLSYYQSSLLGASLVYMDPQTKVLKPYLAESYTSSTDGKTWTFTLRSGVKFHDGTPLTAAIYKESFERMLAPETASLQAGGFAAIQSITAPDDKTLIFQLKEPSAMFLTNLSDPSLGQPLLVSAIKKYGKDYGRNPIGVGPWKFESWKTGESITLVRNEEYQWANPKSENQGPVRPDKVVFKFIQDRQTMMAALDSGTIDIAIGVIPKDVKKYKNNDTFAVLESLRKGPTFMEMNLTNEILQDINVRKALNMAINKEVMVQSVLHGEGVSTYGPLSPNSFGFDPSVDQYGYKYNVEEAKKLLEASGWKENAQGMREKNGKRLALNLLSRTTFATENQLVQSMLKEMGVDVKIQVVEQASLLDLAVKGSFDLLLLSYVANDPSTLNEFLHSNQIGGSNFSRVQDKQLDSLLEEGGKAMDRVERQKIYADIQKVIVEQAYWIPLYTEKDFYVVNKRVHGVKLLPMLGFDFQDSWVNE